MIIDFHAHVFPDKIASKTIELLSEKGGIPAFSDGSFGGLLSSMRTAGVDISVNLPVITNPAQFDSVNRFAAAINGEFSKCGRGIVSFAGIHPACDGLEEKMAWIKEMGFLGVKIHPDYQETYFDDERYLRILSAAKELDLAVVTHAGVDGGFRGCPVRATPERSAKVIEAAGHSKLVLAHLGANEMHDEVIRFLCGKDVYFDTAYVLRYVDRSDFLKIVDLHGKNKILFASDSPWSDQAGDVKILKSYSLDKSTEEMILCENAKALLGI